MDKKALENRIHELESELRSVKAEMISEHEIPETVNVPEAISDMFLNIEKDIRDYFSDLNIDPASGEITVQGQRYILLRTDSVSHEFVDFFKERYSEKTEQEAVSIGNNFLYDNAKVFGKKDALAFHKKLNLKNPIEKLSAGPVHFAFTGWANVEIFEESRPVPDKDYFLKFTHHNSFEAQSWIKAGKKSSQPVCTMNTGYSAGWCEESFGMPLTTVEVSCEAKGDDSCTFIMAPTDRIEEYVGELHGANTEENIEIPVFFQRKNIEEQLRNSVEQKEMLIKEIHHRVKNNLQVISSLLRLQMGELKDDSLRDEFESSINRVNTMAVVHELMYQRKDFDSVNMYTYFEELVKSLVNLYSIKQNVEVEVKINVPEVDFDLGKSIPLALILNEITCNSFKHGLDEGGKFYLKLEKRENDFLLIVGDNGTGIKNTEQEGGLGLALIDILLDQIDATKELSNSENGLEYRIVFQLEE